MRPKEARTWLTPFAHPAFARCWWLGLGAVLAHLNSLLAAATFPILDSETRLAGDGPVAISRDTAIVGNLVYVRTPAGWLFQQVLNGFGAVALDGDTAVVGTNVYIRAGAHWDLQATLPFSYWSGFEGTSLAHDLIAVGIPYQSVS